MFERYASIECNSEDFGVSSVTGIRKLYRVTCGFPLCSIFSSEISANEH